MGTVGIPNDHGYIPLDCQLRKLDVPAISTEDVLKRVFLWDATDSRCVLVIAYQEEGEWAFVNCYL